MTTTKSPTILIAFLRRRAQLGLLLGFVGLGAVLATRHAPVAPVTLELQAQPGQTEPPTGPNEPPAEPPTTPGGPPGSPNGPNNPLPNGPSPESLGPQVAGRWSKVQTWPVIAINLGVLPNGKVISWGTGDPGGKAINADVWDPTTGTHTRVRNPDTDLFCAAQTLLGDGRLLIAGGHMPNSDGSSHSTYFDYRTNRFSRGPDMNAGRWYPGILTLSDGQALVYGGHTLANKASPLAPTFNYLPQRLQNGTWTSLETANLRVNHGYYPRMTLLPNGNVFVAGPEPQMSVLDLGRGEWSSFDQLRDGIDRRYGSSVVIEPGKLLMLGGAGQASGVLLDFSRWPDLGLNPTKPMHFARLYHNSVILPTGEVLVVGGQSQYVDGDANEVLRSESWNPQTGDFSLRAAQHVPRLYHSTAVLLPDGRVLSAGGGAGGKFLTHQNAELYTPWYMFKPDGKPAARPAILDAPSQVSYHQDFRVQSRDAARIARVTFVRLGATTHALDFNQRFYEVGFQRSISAPDVLRVVAPNDPRLTPPGHYLMFLIDAFGVPSLAKVVQFVTDEP